MKREEILSAINKFWDLAIQSMHETSPMDKGLPTTSGRVEDSLHELYNKHRENQLELFEGLLKVGEKRR